MADNTTLNTGSGGDVIASDDITGVKYQRIKLVLGADGINGGDVASGNPLPISDNASSLTVDAPVATPVFVRLSDGAAAIATLPVSLASLPTLAAGVNNIGDVDVLTLPALTAGANTIGAVTAPGAAALALDATLTGGTAKAVARGGAKGTAVAGDVTSNPVDANTQALHVNLAGTNTVALSAGAAIIGALTANQSVNTAQINGVAPLMGTGISGTGAQRVTLATDIALPTGANVIGALTANQSTNIAQMNGVAVTMGSGVTGTGVQRVVLATDVALPAGANSIGTVNGPALTKGTQGAVGFSTQDLKDAGRNFVTYYSVIPVLTSATDTLQSLTGTKSGATVVATTTPAVVTTGKTLRVINVAATYVATATSGYVMVRLRFNTAGVVAIGSPVAANIAVGAGTPATANSVGIETMPLPDGLEFAAGTGIGISAQGFTAVTATAVGYVQVMVQGYEY